MIHITSGDSAADLLRASGLPGEVIGWRDSAALGPSPGGISFAEYRAVRAAFRGVSAETLQDVDLLAALPEDEEMVLWFDACPYDQMILVRLLDWFGAQPARRALQLIEVGAFPGVEPFYGLGQLTAEQLAGLFPTRRAVTESQLALATAAWRAHGSPDPREIERLIERVEDGEDLPYLRPALRRLLEQFPAAEDGLSRTERECLEAVAAGESSFGGIFRAITRLEEPNHGCWYGDGELLSTLQELAAAPLPALTQTGDHFELTELGRALLAGEADWVARHEGDRLQRWQGGVHLEGKKVWRWERQGGRLLHGTLLSER
ncbi:MAG TPA: DUF1835 domain-containing protein [Thermoanaerobaculia bacterium]|nr:DUF1835 domain-containing protein [Thermoanaerobaculia bacterium]